MTWRGIWHLGSRYLRRNPVKTALLVAAFTLVWLLPALVGLIVSKAEEHLRSRAADTPLVIGRTGSPLELVFNGLYFSKPDQTTFPLKEAKNHEVSGITVIPIYSRFAAQENRIVGTSVDYFDFRSIGFKEGRPFIRMGECVIGSAMAEQRGLKVGDHVKSSPESLFDLAGVYPLKMKICGILAPKGTADDGAVFVDLKTAWVIEGLGHGHEDAKMIDEDGRLENLDEEDETIQLNASVVHYNEITPENAKDFHFHGDIDDFPVTAAIAIAENDKAQALLKGRYQSRTDMQVIVPAEEMDELFDTVFKIQNVVIGVLVIIGIATLVIGFLVFLLSYRLRKSEFRSLANMGADPGFMRCLVAFEAAFVFIASIAIAAAIIGLLNLIAPYITRMLVI